MNDNITGAIERALGRLEGKCDTIIASLAQHSERMNRIDQDVEDNRKEIKQEAVALREELSKIKDDIAEVRKKQYTIVVLATLVWGIIVAFIKKYLF